MFGRKKKKAQKKAAKAEKARNERVPTEERVPPSTQNRIFFFLIMAGIVFLSAMVFRPFTVPVLAGILLAYLSFPVYKFFRTVVRIRGIAAVLALLFILGILVVPLAFLGIALVDDAREFATGLRDTEPPEILLAGLDLWIKTRVDDPNNATQIEEEKQSIVDDSLKEASAWLIDALPAAASLVADFVLGLFIVAFVMFYIFVDGERLVSFVRRTVALPPHQTDYILRETGNAVDAIFVGQLFSALLQGLVGGVGFWLFGVPNAFFWGAVMALLSILPIIGAFLVWLPAGLYLLAIGETTNGIMLLLWGAILVSNVDNVAKPILIGDRADIHPILVLIGILGGLIVFGPIGFIVGPLILGVLVAVLKVWNAEYHDWNGWIRRGDRDGGAARKRALEKKGHDPDTSLPRP